MSTYLPMLKTINVLPISVDKLSEEDIKYGITEARQAKFFIQYDNVVIENFVIPKEGGTYQLKTPLQAEQVTVYAHLNIYDRQTEYCFFSVSNLRQGSLKPDELGRANIQIEQQGPAICFSMFQV